MQPPSLHLFLSIGFLCSLLGLSSRATATTHFGHPLPCPLPEALPSRSYATSTPPPSSLVNYRHRPVDKAAAAARPFFKSVRGQLPRQPGRARRAAAVHWSLGRALLFCVQRRCVFIPHFWDLLPTALNQLQPRATPGRAQRNPKARSLRACATNCRRNAPPESEGRCCHAGTGAELASSARGSRTPHPVGRHAAARPGLSDPLARPRTR